MLNATASETLMLFGPDTTAAALPMGDLVAALQVAFSQGAEVPMRHHHTIEQRDGKDATLLLMPAWQSNGGVLGVKIVTVYPGNAARNLPGLHSTYLLCDGLTGKHLALIDGNQITVRRTVGTAALAASYLARKAAKRLLIVGAGRVGSRSPSAFSAVRNIEEFIVWDRDPTLSEKLVSELIADGSRAGIASDLESAVRSADIVTCATLSNEPLIKYEWLAPGAHLDLIGSFTPQMREADNACFARASVFIDSPDALKESGDLIDPITAGDLDAKDICGTLSDLCSGRIAGRRDEDEITVFKAVGTGLSDLAAGALAFRNLSRGTLPPP